MSQAFPENNMALSDSLLRFYVRYENAMLHKVFSKCANFVGRLNKARVRRRLGSFLDANHPNLGIVLYDVGAAGGISGIFAPISRLAGFRAFGFDPDQGGLPAHPKGYKVTFFPFGLAGMNGNRLLHITQSPGCSSLLEPDQQALGEFPVAGLFRQTKLSEVPTMTLDSFVSDYKAPYPDFLKLDVQGCELEILQGCSFLRAKVSALTLETHLRQIYKGEGLFPAIHSFLVGMGYRLVGHGYSPHFAGEILEMDVSYVKSPSEIKSAEMSIKAAVFCACLGNIDYAAHIIVDSALDDSQKNSWIRFLGRDKRWPECIQTRRLKIASACAQNN